MRFKTVYNMSELTNKYLYKKICCKIEFSFSKGNRLKKNLRHANSTINPNPTQQNNSRLVVS